jgi:hypothetical protein
MTTLSINEFIKLIEKEFGSDAYRAVGPDGKVYTKGDQRLLGIPDERFVLPYVPANRVDDAPVVGRPNRGRGRK